MPQSHGRVEGELKPILPVGNRILIRPHETPEYKGSIIVPDSVKTVVPVTGVILALAWDMEEGAPFRTGDAIVFSKYGGVELTFDDGNRVMIVHVDDILGIVEANVVPKESAIS